MAGKTLTIKVERDHLESLTRANEVTAISELIWNSLDADASDIRISRETKILHGTSQITIKDDGSGLKYEDAEGVFENIGGSLKKITHRSPGGRQYHGKEGKGRYKALALGDLVTFKSWFYSGNNVNHFNVVLDRNSIKSPVISELSTVTNINRQSGFEVVIDNVNLERGNRLFTAEVRRELEYKFAAYWLNYPQFKISIEGRNLEFNSLIKDSYQEKLIINNTIEDRRHHFNVRILEWDMTIAKKTFLCNKDGVPFMDIALGIRSSLPISIFLQGNYIEELHRDNKLDFYKSDEFLTKVLKEAKKVAKSYVRKKLHNYSIEYIESLKEKGVYPYKGEAESKIESDKRQVFDIITLQIHDHLPAFDDQNEKTIKLTLSLLKEALENEPTKLRKIFSDILDLNQEKQDDLYDLLEVSTFSDIIDTMTEVKNRLSLINGLEQIIYDKEINHNIKERQHLHQIVARETWIFGDHYSMGVDDVTLRNVLKKYLKDVMKREDFESIVESEDNSDLELIPDVCLFKQFSQGTMGYENLVVELKRPTVNAGFEEKSQIERYAARVSSDRRFPKRKTRWKFLLLTQDITKDLKDSLKQPNRPFGLVTEGENYEVYVLPWGHVLMEARARLTFLKDKLNMSWEENEEGIKYLSNNYSKYLPDDFGEEE